MDGGRHLPRAHQKGDRGHRLRVRADREDVQGSRRRRRGSARGARRVSSRPVHAEIHQSPHGRIRRQFREQVPFPRGGGKGDQSRMRRGLSRIAQILRGEQDQGVLFGRGARRGLRRSRQGYGRERKGGQIPPGRRLRYVQCGQRHLRRVVLGASACLYAAELQPRRRGAHQKVR